MKKLGAFLLALLAFWWATGSNVPADDDELVNRFRRNEGL